MIPPRYEPSESQKAQEEYYNRAVKLLVKAGIPAVYNKYWISNEEDPVGYISIQYKE